MIPLKSVPAAINFGLGKRLRFLYSIQHVRKREIHNKGDVATRLAAGESEECGEGQRTYT